MVAYAWVAFTQVRIVTSLDSVLKEQEVCCCIHIPVNAIFYIYHIEQNLPHWIKTSTGPYTALQYYISGYQQNLLPDWSWPENAREALQVEIGRTIKVFIPFLRDGNAEFFGEEPKPKDLPSLELG